MNVVYLSRRNLETLLAKLDNPSSHKTIVKCDTKHLTHPCTVVTAVTAVDDKDYYVDREPGYMLEDERL